MYVFFLILIIIVILIVAYIIHHEYSKPNHKHLSHNINNKKNSPQSKFTKEILTNLIDKGTLNNLTEYIIPPSYTVLDNNTFSECINLKDIYLSEDINWIEDKSFIKCGNLVSINIDDDNKNYCSKKGTLFTKDLNNIITYPSAKQSSTYFIPQEVKIINSYAFTNNNYIKYLILPNTITTISENAFFNCKELKQIVIPPNVTCIHQRAFNICPRLTIRGYKDSIAEEYCKKYYIPFEYLND